jgi:thiol-disulfide isomerase/thioredoxin
MTRYLLVLLLLIFPMIAGAQSVTGTLPGQAGAMLTLSGYQGLETIILGEARTSAEGRFTIHYPPTYRGMGFVSTSDGESFLMVLAGEDIVLTGQSLADTESIIITQSDENRALDRYATEHPAREQTLSAWVYLNRIYQSDSLFIPHTAAKAAIRAEMQRIRQEDEDFIASLDAGLYVRWYLPLRKLIMTVPAIAQFRTDEIPGAIAAFRGLDYTDDRLHRSGLLQNVLESHVWLIENSGRSLDQVFEELNRSMDIILPQLSAQPAHLNEIMGFYFDFMEQRSLFTSSEYLALQLLENHADLLTPQFSARLERYRALRIGNPAPEIRFMAQTYRPVDVPAGIDRLSAMPSDYTVVVFAAGWCPHCREMMPELREKARTWKNYGVEVVVVSLDDTREGFQQLADGAPFLVTTDFQRWNTPSARDYHIYSVPSMFLLDRQKTIVLRPNSVTHMDAWVDWFLVQGNPR